MIFSQVATLAFFFLQAMSMSQTGAPQMQKLMGMYPGVSFCDSVLSVGPVIQSQTSVAICLTFPLTTSDVFFVVRFIPNRPVAILI